MPTRRRHRSWRRSVAPPHGRAPPQCGFGRDFRHLRPSTTDREHRVESIATSGGQGRVKRGDWWRVSEDDDDTTEGLDASEEEGASRRKDPRASLVLPIEYRNAGHLLVSYCTNLSRGGLFLPTPEPLPKGDTLTLSLRIPGRERPVSIEAVVRWARGEDSARGPAGMGVAFYDVDGLLGDTIDTIVARFVPLRVELVGARPAAWHHVAALARSLLTCETREHRLAPDLAPVLEEADLVIVDLERYPERGIGVLEQLGQLRRPPPRIALCPGRDDGLRPQAAALARVVPTPVDNRELRQQVLEAVSEVHARWPEQE